MSFSFDPEIRPGLAALAEIVGDLTLPPAGDALALRAFTDAGLVGTFARLPDAPDVEVAAYAALAHDGAEIPLRWYSKAEASGGAAVVYVHGGGMICGSAAIYDRLVRHYVRLAGVPFLSVDYRLAPEHRGQGLARDVIVALRWLRAQADRLGVDPARISVMGGSGGGGVAAGAAILARDEGLPLARQILIYPMLDDRNIAPDPLLAPTALWSYENNRTAWSAVLAERLGRDDAPPWLAPARLADFAGLAPAYIEVGELDIFRDESLAYAQKLLAVGVSCEFHLIAGAPHVHDWLNPDSNLSRQVLAERVRLLGLL